MRTRVLSARATGMPALDAQADFRRARRDHAAGRVRRWVTGGRSSSRPATLPEPAPVLGGRPLLKVVPLSQIIGTVDPTSHFDASFRPASELVRQRWERIALAQRRGIALPPIELVQGSRGYYVVDGRHRVSVARALHHADIDAWVYRAVTAPEASDGARRHSPSRHARQTETQPMPAAA